MVDWDGLENRCAFTGTVGSNPTLSARPHNDAPARAGGSETIPEISAIQPDPGLVPSFRGGLYVCRAIFADNILGTRCASFTRVSPYQSNQRAQRVGVGSPAPEWPHYVPPRYAPPRYAT
ncbi:hypothetical protein AA102526_1646 [Asaia lannensis NBRC 102526]|nr:hypothetical protein AA102526_1646 [Asaia lannensis NBRC 102526]